MAIPLCAYPSRRGCGSHRRASPLRGMHEKSQRLEWGLRVALDVCAQEPNRNSPSACYPQQRCRARVAAWRASSTRVNGPDPIAFATQGGRPPPPPPPPARFPNTTPQPPRSHRTLSPQPGPCPRTALASRLPRCSMAGPNFPGRPWGDPLMTAQYNVPSVCTSPTALVGPAFMEIAATVIVLT